jgi:hypothetical protein
MFNCIGGLVSDFKLCVSKYVSNRSSLRAEIRESGPFLFFLWLLCCFLGVLGKFICVCECRKAQVPFEF